MNPLLELLEDRIAPAGVAQFTDVDGDVFRVNTTGGTNAALQAAIEQNSNQVTRIDLSAATHGQLFAGSSLTFKLLQRGATGDGAVNIGFIDATGVDLGAVTVPGDLGRIIAGDVIYTTAGLKSLQTFSVGIYGTFTQNGTGDTISTIQGPVGSIEVFGNVKEANFVLESSGAQKAHLGILKVGGSIVGSNTDANLGGFLVEGTIRSGLIGGDLVGRSGVSTGFITAESATVLTIQGHVIGGDGNNSGSINMSALSGRITVGGNLTGGDGTSSGRVNLTSGALSVTVGGNVEGGGGLLSGRINTVGIITVQGNLIGSDGDSSGQLIGGRSVTVDGSIIGGEGAYSGFIDLVNAGTLVVGGSIIGGKGENSATVFANGSITSLRIDGSLIGGEGLRSGQIDSNFGSSVPGVVTIGGDIRGGDGNESGSLTIAQTVAMNVRGSVVGGDGSSSGYVVVGGLTSLRIGGGILGGTASAAGAVIATGFSTGTAWIGGSIVGGSSNQSGILDLTGAFSALTVRGSIVGGDADQTGYVTISGNIARVEVGGSIVGGRNASESGLLQAGNIDSLLVRGSIKGGTNTMNNAETESGAVIASAIKAATIRGSIIGGNETFAKTSTSFGALRAWTTIGALTVGGNMEGGNINALLTAGGNLTAKGNLAIASLSVGGNVTNSTILAGYGTTGTGLNGNGAATNAGTAQIGSVNVGGNWVQSSIAAGSTTGADLDWGDNSNALLSKGTSTLIASIASINIRGNAWTGSDTGIVAERLLKITIAGLDVTPLPTQNNVGFGPTGTDFRFRQLGV
ncbi:MAG: hypothetical protein SFU53_06810 [Terrimicrobiaceae bacterium]|nr:hypothetical protein [Terrimicrobiaceae bacterium]